MPRLKNLLAGTALGLLFLLQPAQSNAAFILKLDDGVNPARVIYDDVAVPPPGTNPDGLPGTPGALMFSGTYGNYSLVVSVGGSKPAQGTAAAPHLTLTTFVISGPSAGTLTLSLTDTDFTPIPPYFVSATGGTANGSVQVSTFADFTNAEFGTGTPLSSFGPFGPPVFSDDEQVNKSGNTPYSLTIVTAITHTTAGTTQVTSEIVSGDVVEAPEPTTWALAGLGFVGLTAWGWRRRQAA